MSKIWNLVKRPFSFLFLINRYMVLSFILFFFLSYTIVLIFLVRGYTVNILKNEYIKLQTSLNDMGWDVAYEDLSFNKLWPFDLVKAKDLKIYKLSDGIATGINISKLTLNPSLYNGSKINIEISPDLSISKKGKTLNIEIQKQHISAKYTEAEGLREILLELQGINIKDYAEIEEIQFGAQRMAPQSINLQAPFFENHLVVNNVVFASNQDLILTDTIEKIYLNANIIGQIKSSDSYKDSIYDWLALDGYFDIKTFVINWKPLLLVGKGSLYFNEKLEPNLRLSTSSKAMITTLDILEKKELLDRKGVFVTRILLANKAFTLSPLDEHDTVVTPIHYKDKKLSVENITVKTF